VIVSCIDSAAGRWLAPPAIDGNGRRRVREKRGIDVVCYE
jgi:hypothetical protein